MQWMQQNTYNTKMKDNQTDLYMKYDGDNRFIFINFGLHIY